MDMRFNASFALRFQRMRSLRRHDDPYIGAGLGLAGVLFVLYVYPGFMSPVPSHFDGVCHAIPMSAGAEDLRIDPTTGVAYFSYFERATGGPRNLGEGTVMLVDLNAAEPRVRAALATQPPHFAPTGLSLYTPPGGPKRLFVVNRAQLGTHSIVIFDQSPTGAFTPAETLSNRLLWSPTAIVAVGPKQFYVVNDSGFKERDEPDAKKYVVGKLRGNRGTVVYFDGERAQVVAEGLGVPNGVAVSPDGHTLYVSESNENQIRRFDRDPASGALKPGGRIELDTSPHNINLDADGNLWVNAHPRGGIAFSLPPDAGKVTFPTQVLKVVPGAESGKQVSEIYLNDGSELLAGSVAAVRGNQLVIGSATDHKLLLCTQGASAGASSKPPITGPERET
jgi:arylesterase/paraoxonase